MKVKVDQVSPLCSSRRLLLMTSDKTEKKKKKPESAIQCKVVFFFLRHRLHRVKMSNIDVTMATEFGQQCFSKMCIFFCRKGFISYFIY